MLAMATKRKKVEIVAEPTSTCKSCRHAWFLEADDEVVWLCRRYPPTVTYDPAEACPVSSFPIVAPEITCGEFAAQLNS
jgi:hypothetical protein